MDINEILLKLIHFATIIAFLMLGGILFMRGELPIGIIILGLAIVYFIFRNKKSLMSPNPEITTTESATRIATAWMGILLLVVVHILEVPSVYWILLVPVSIFLLFLWFILTGR